MLRLASPEPEGCAPAGELVEPEDLGSKERRMPQAYRRDERPDPKALRLPREGSEERPRFELCVAIEIPDVCTSRM